VLKEMDPEQNHWKQDDTIAVREGENFDLQAMHSFLLQHIAEVTTAPLEVRQFPSGASNLTYLLRCGDWEGVLRRPPFGPLPPKAHDMKRESDILRRLHAAFALAPKPYVFCDDPTIIGASFYIMERRKGIVIDSVMPQGVAPSKENCEKLSCALIDTLAALHQVDYRSAGLSDFGHPDGFLIRQVNGWISRYDRAKTDEIEVFDRLSAWLLENIPTSKEATIIHNDFKFNNLIVAPTLDRVVAVLDWEMSTIADPLFDLGVTLGYWIQDDDPELLQSAFGSVTKTPGFIKRREFVHRYSLQTGRDVDSLDFYLTFAYFKLAVVLQQIYYRWKNGQTQDERFAAFKDSVRNLMTHAYNVSQKGID
jgi:aminoglycoside phosphotransferase (APT) family kinase protein